MFSNSIHRLVSLFAVCCAWAAWGCGWRNNILASSIWSVIWRPFQSTQSSRNCPRSTEVLGSLWIRLSCSDCANWLVHSLMSFFLEQVLDFRSEEYPTDAHFHGRIISSILFHAESVWTYVLFHSCLEQKNKGCSWSIQRVIVEIRPRRAELWQAIQALFRIEQSWRSVEKTAHSLWAKKRHEMLCIKTDSFCFEGYSLEDAISKIVVQIS